LYKVDILVHEEGDFLDKDLIGDHDDFTPQRGRQTLNHLLLFIQRVQVFTVVPQEVFNSGRHLLRQVHSVSQVVKNLDLSGQYDTLTVRLSHHVCQVSYRNRIGDVADDHPENAHNELYLPLGENITKADSSSSLSSPVDRHNILRESIFVKNARPISPGVGVEVSLLREVEPYTGE